MLVPVKFILDNVQKGRIDALRCYLSARALGMNHAGYFNIKDITWITYQSKLRLLKKLESWGWTKDNKMVSVYKIEGHPVSADCDPDVLKDKKKFKGWILSIAESYVARNNFRINKGWKKEIDYRSKKLIRKQSVSGVSKFSESEYITEIANSFISSLLGISTRTVCRWRKYSLNQYKLTKKFAQSQYAFEEGKCFFDEKTKLWAQWSQMITTKIFIYFSGEKHLQKCLFSSNSTPVLS